MVVVILTVKRMRILLAGNSNETVFVDGSAALSVQFPYTRTLHGERQHNKIAAKFFAPPSLCSCVKINITWNFVKTRAAV